MQSAPKQNHEFTLSSASPVVLMTGFDAFGRQPINSSWLAVSALQGEQIDGHLIAAAQLPTTFANSIEKLSDLVDLYQPKLVICTGQAGGRTAVSMERIAININDARIADNLGQQPVGQAVVDGAPAAYFSTLPIKSMLLDLENAGFAAEISQTAGTFVCNHVFYGLMHIIAKRYAARDHETSAGLRGGFIHLPWLPEQGSPSMPLDAMVIALRICVSSALNHITDLSHAAGSLN